MSIATYGYLNFKIIDQFTGQPVENAKLSGNMTLYNSYDNSIFQNQDVEFQNVLSNSDGIITLMLSSTSSQVYAIIKWKVIYNDAVKTSGYYRTSTYNLYMNPMGEVIATIFVRIDTSTNLPDKNYGMAPPIYNVYIQAVDNELETNLTDAVVTSSPPIKNPDVANYEYYYVLDGSSGEYLKGQITQISTVSNLKLPSFPLIIWDYENINFDLAPVTYTIYIKLPYTTIIGDPDYTIQAPKIYIVDSDTLEPILNADCEVNISFDNPFFNNSRTFIDDNGDGTVYTGSFWVRPPTTKIIINGIIKKKGYENCVFDIEKDIALVIPDVTLKMNKSSSYDPDDPDEPDDFDTTRHAPPIYRVSFIDKDDVPIVFSLDITSIPEATYNSSNNYYEFDSTPQHILYGRITELPITDMAGKKPLDMPIVLWNYNAIDFTQPSEIKYLTIKILDENDSGTNTFEFASPLIYVIDKDNNQIIDANYEVSVSFSPTNSAMQAFNTSGVTYPIGLIDLGAFTLSSSDIVATIDLKLTHPDYKDVEVSIETSIANAIQTVYIKMNDKSQGGITDMSTGIKYYSQIEMLVDPTLPNHVTRLKDVLDLVDGKTKGPVKVITTANLSVTYSAKVLTASADGTLGAIDNITLAVNDRILVNGQTDHTQNGIYTVTSLGGANARFTLTRADDMDADDEIIEGFRVFISEGTIYAGTVWKLQGTAPFVLDTDNIDFVQDIVKYREIAEKIFDVVGDGNTTDITISHGFGTKNVTLEFFDATTGENVEVFAQRTSVNDVKLIFGYKIPSDVAIKVIARAVLNPS
ncbi:MAG: hypothetical protein LBD57_04505 [Endomicrobium sp.]|jgi:hypothetical protein|uniref:hypothetical protein n=1 Tax=Candidatus Endomicrobiellum cubanum TaxID=3242325 RepID=UPI002830B871|nr:hypothetical protein [Endomicrobium sp.]